MEVAEVWSSGFAELGPAQPQLVQINVVLPYAL